MLTRQIALVNGTGRISLLTFLPRNGIIHSALHVPPRKEYEQSLPEILMMIQTDSILSSKDIQLCLVLGYLIQELAVLITQAELLDNPYQNHLLITLP